ncbi:MAG: GNAT family N-acetyltransferase [Tissierellia bacterium]|nr:GNAT family N-acetyltransferase [Tissierellia bacterium]
MSDVTKKKPVSFYELKWDSDFFKVTCAKAILHEPLSRDEWDDLKEKFNDYQLISIENQHSDPVNSQLIGKETSAFLADVNIQFAKKLEFAIEKPDNVTVQNYLAQDEQIVEMAEFRYSKFIEDKEFYKRNGSQIYKQWIINCFNKPDKYFVISRNEKGEIDGFLLHSFSESVCKVELLAVAKNSAGRGIGTRLFRMTEYDAKRKGCDEIRVGTMIRNLNAINFYHKMGCKQIGCHQIYHLWRL